MKLDIIEIVTPEIWSRAVSLCSIDVLQGRRSKVTGLFANIRVVEVLFQGIIVYIISIIVLLSANSSFTFLPLKTKFIILFMYTYIVAT